MIESIKKELFPNYSRLQRTAFILRWAARLTAALLLGTVLIIVVCEVVWGGGGPNFAKMNWTVRSMFAAEIVAIFDLAVIWRRELLGGLLVLGGIITFDCLNYLISGQLPIESLPLFYIPGVLAVLSWILARLAKTTNNNQSP